MGKKLKYTYGLFELMNKTVDSNQSLYRKTTIKYINKQSFVENADMIFSKLIDWLNEMPVLSYNGGKYDINLIKHHLHNALNEIDEPVTFCIKKCSSYAAMKTKHFKFLDVMA